MEEEQIRQYSFNHKDKVTAVEKEGREEGTYLRPISPLDVELVLEHDQIPLARLVLHETLQPRAESIQQVPSAHFRDVVGEETDPSETGNDTSRLRLVRELGDRLDLLDENAIRRDAVSVSVGWDNS